MLRFCPQSEEFKMWLDLDCYVTCVCVGSEWMIHCWFTVSFNSQFRNIILWCVNDEFKILWHQNNLGTISILMQRMVGNKAIVQCCYSASIKKMMSPHSLPQCLAPPQIFLGRKVYISCHDCVFCSAGGGCATFQILTRFLIFKWKFNLICLIGDLHID
jgi:hypothetical protein